MRERRRHPTPEEVEIIMARARRMRSIYVAALISTALQRLRQAYADATQPRRGAARRYYPDVG